MNGHLLASAALTGQSLLWARYKRLLVAVQALGFALQDANVH